MRHILFLALGYLTYHKLRTAILILALTVTFFLPAAVGLVASVSETYLTQRSQATPLVLGSSGSALDLVMNALYFRGIAQGGLVWGDLRELEETGLARVLPLHSLYKAQGVPLIGTTLEYFGFRDLEIAQGRFFAVLGECVLGAEAARTLGLVPGDKIVTDSENPFDLAGTYPLRLTVTGVLAPGSGWDDKGIFVDIKTAWVAGGFGHGHQDLTRGGNQGVILQREGENITANASLVEYNEITPENRKDFHFHGRRENYPLSSAIVIPPSPKSQALLLSRYSGKDQPRQLVEPEKEILRLLDTLFRIRKILGALMAVTLGVTLLVVVFILALTVRLRQAESETLYKIGGGRQLLMVLTGAETLLVSLASLVLAGILGGITWGMRDFFLEFLVRG